MKRIILLILICALLPLQMIAQSFTVGSNCIFTPYLFDGDYSLIMDYRDNNNANLTGDIIVKFRLNDGTDLVLHGIPATENYISNSSGSSLGSYSYSSGSTVSNKYVIFRITKEQIKRFEIGVDKVAINTIPTIYYREKWSGKKSFGKDLYNAFNELKDIFDMKVKPGEWE